MATEDRTGFLMALADYLVPAICHIPTLRFVAVN